MNKGSNAAAADLTTDVARVRLSRDDILDVASKQFALTGYRGTNLGQVSDALGVTRQAIYYYFPKKHDLLIALFVRFFDLLDGAADEATANSQPGREQFDSMLRAHIRIVASDPSLSSVFGEGRGNLPAAASELIQRRRKNYNDRFIAAYQQGVADGDLSADVPAIVAVDLVVGAANWVHRWYRSSGRISPEKLGVIAQQFLADGYGRASALE
jgi:AcrR family transcriptional regulator